MTGEDDGREPGGYRCEPGGDQCEPSGYLCWHGGDLCWHDGVPAHSQSLAQELTILAQFGDERVVLDQTEVARLTDCTCSTAQRCLVTLTALGYLTEAHNGGYRLVGGELDLIHAQRSEDGTPDTAA
jgi:hypothetical protein